MIFRWLTVVMVAVGCRAQTPPPVAGEGATAKGSPIERAQAYERGAGVPRDYREAARIYEAACADGKGDLEACHRFLDRLNRGRGVAVDHGRMVVIGEAMCRRRAAYGCLNAAFGRAPDGLQVPEGLAETQALAPVRGCEKGDALACDAAFLILLLSSTSPSDDRERRD